MLNYFQESQKHVCIFCHFEISKLYRLCKSYPKETRSLFLSYSLYHSCWWAIDAKGQSLSNHCADPILLKYFSLNSTLQWRHNERTGVSNHRVSIYLPNRLFGRRSKRTSKLRVTGLNKGNPPMTGEFPAKRASIAENVSIWWRPHENALGFGKLFITNYQKSTF